MQKGIEIDTSPAELKDKIETVRADRIEICKNCMHHSKNHFTPLRFDDHCVECGCNIEAKTSCLTCECPFAYWKKIVDTDEDFHNLMNYIQ